MAETFLSKAGAVVLSGAAILGVAYGVAKYVADFEAAKTEIQNLRGQITQLHELLAKGQGGSVDVARIERLEKEVAELRVKAGIAVAMPPENLGERLAAGFNGKAGDNSGSWPFRATNVKMLDNGQFEADLEWVSLDAIHRIRGKFTDRSLFFKEVEKIKAGNNVIGCEYTLDTVRPDGLEGTWRNCDASTGGGTIQLSWR